MYRLWIMCILFGCCILFINMDCQESLPPYKAPQSVFSLELSCSFPNPDRIYLNIYQQILGHKKIYFDLDLINIFDETLSDSSQPDLGEIELWWNDDPNVSATIPIKYSDEISGYTFEFPPSVTIDPGDTVHFAVWWPYCLDNEDKYIWENVEETWESEDENYIYTNYGPMDFTLQARLQPFPRGPIVYSNIYQVSITFQADRPKSDSTKFLDDPNSAGKK